MCFLLERAPLWTVTQRAVALPVVWHRVRSNSIPTRLVAAFALCLAALGLAATDAPTARAAGSNVVTVTAREYSYVLSGAPKEGWTRLTFENRGAQYHQLLVVPLKPGVTRSQVQQAVAVGEQGSTIPSIGTGLAPGIPFLLPPNAEATSIAQLDAGRYALLSLLTAPDGASDAARGMVAFLRVRSGTSKLAPPAKSVVDVTTSDSAITLPGGALPARGWARITTTASSPRDFELFRYATPDATFEAASAYFREFFSSGSPPPGPPPAVIVGNISSIARGTVVYYQLSLDLGRYVAVSDTATDQDGSAQVHTDFTVG
jgi:hypothetical protein